MDQEPYKPNLGGRPAIDFDLDKLEELSALMCTYEEIAHFFSVSLSTVEKRMHDDPRFRSAVERGQAHGRISVRRKQKQMLDAGDRTMAVWLGKIWLRQTDRPDQKGKDGKPLIPLEAYRAMLDARRAEIDAEPDDPQSPD